MEQGAIAVFGATRGLGLAIAHKYAKKGYHPIIIGRSNVTTDLGDDFTSINIDFDEDESVLRAVGEVTSTVANREIKLLSSHFLSGGSLGLYPDDSDNEIAKYLSIYRHNAIIPFWLASEIEKACIGLVDNREFHFYSSAVSTNKNAHPVYAASKTALESSVISMMRSRRRGQYIFLYRLGLVSVAYKYPYKLSIENPDEFKEKFMKFVPAKHFTSPNEVANIAFHSSNNRDVLNCMINDISGGQSWI